MTYRIIRICSNSSEYCPGLENEFSPLDDWKLHLQYRMKKVPTAPSKLSSRLEDLQRDLKCRIYKDSSLLLAFEKALLIPREKALEKVERKEEKENIISASPPRLHLSPGGPGRGQFTARPTKRWEGPISRVCLPFPSTGFPGLGGPREGTPPRGPVLLLRPKPQQHWQGFLVPL